MNDLIRRDDSEEQLRVVATLRQFGSTAISTVTETRVVQWLRSFFGHLADFVQAGMVRYQYVRNTRKEFDRIMSGLKSGDGDARACYNLCTRFHAMLDKDERIAFASVVVSFHSTDTAGFIRYFADRERNYLQQVLAQISI